jgi:8-oxo-dGTP diphosphatase
MTDRMSLLLIRHASAGDRSSWKGPDAERPLDDKGRRQADKLVQRYGSEPFARLLSSPYERCVQTLVPLSLEVGLPLEVTAALAEGAPVSGSLALLEELGDTTAALCIHGDVIPDLLDALEREGVPLHGVRACTKGSVWRLDTDGDVVIAATYLGR